MSRTRQRLTLVLAAGLVLAGAARAQGAPASVPAPAAPAPAAPAATARVLTLDEAVATALRQQPNLVQARANTTASEARADQARAGLLPQLNASAGYLHQDGSGANVSAGDSLRAGLTLSQLIYDFGQTSGRWRAAQATAGAARSTQESTRAQVVFGVQSAFFTARAAKDLVAVAQENLSNRDAHLQQIQGFVRAGTRPEIDLAQARADRSSAAVTLINAQNAYATDRALLNQAMGVEGPTDYEVSSEQLSPVQGEELTLEPLLAEALKNRPDVAALQAQLDAQELTATATRGGYGPALGLTASASDQYQKLEPATSWSNSAPWTAGVTLTWNLYAGGATSAQVREAEAGIAALRAQVAALQQQARVEVEQARLGVRASREALAAASEALVNARERLRLAEGRYRTGVGSALDLSDAEVGLVTAAAQRVQAEFNLSTSRAQLLHALGRA